MPRSARLMHWAEDSSEGEEVVGFITSKSTCRGCVEVRRRDDKQLNSVLRDELVAACVVQGSLYSSVNSADSEPFGFVEMRHRQVVLPLAVLHHQVRQRPVSIDRQPNATARSARVAREPVESVLTRANLAKHSIAQVQHIGLVAGLSTHGSEATDKPRPLK